MIPETVALAFDPKETKNEEVKEVFSDDLARTIWLATKCNHLTSGYFNNDCLTFAKVIKRLKKKGPLTADLLFNILSGVAMPPGHGIIGSSEREFATELLPFVNGEKIINFTVKDSQQTEEETFQERINRVWCS